MKPTFIDYPGEIEHYYGTFVYVPAKAECPHGSGLTYPSEDNDGVKIRCPEGRDCWVVKWQFQHS